MKCIQGFDIKKKDEKDPNARLDPFVKFRLGQHTAPVSLAFIGYAHSTVVHLCMFVNICECMYACVCLCQVLRRGIPGRRRRPRGSRTPRPSLTTRSSSSTSQIPASSSSRRYRTAGVHVHVLYIHLHVAVLSEWWLCLAGHPAVHRGVEQRHSGRRAHRLGDDERCVPAS